MTTESLTLDEFTMGFEATMRAAANAPLQFDETHPWGVRDTEALLQEMSDEHPDFHAAITGTDPSPQDRRFDVMTKTTLGMLGIGLPEGPVPAEFEELLDQSSIGASAKALKLHE